MLYLVRLSLDHLSFRLPSLVAIADLYGFHIEFVSEDKLRGVLVVELNNDEDARKLLERGTLVMSISRLYAQASSYPELHRQLKDNIQIFQPDMDKSFRVTLEASFHTIPNKRQRQTIDEFAYTDLRGVVDMKNPEAEFVVFEDYDPRQAHTTEEKTDRDGQFVQVYFGRRVGFGQARLLVNSHAVKTRAFYGNTSMEAEMGFLLAAQGLPGPGKIFYDPFVGTGSLLYAAAHWGAYVLGSDIDGRQMRGKNGKGKESIPGIFRAASQYGTREQFWDCLTFDVTKSPIRRGGWIDAIVTDPPYGVRAGAKRLGKKETSKRPMREEAFLMPNGTYSHELPDYVPPFRPYELSDLTIDLILLARYLLVPGGRLVFFLPTITEEWDEVDVPVVEGMRELKIGEGSVQDFGKWGRRLITMEKTAQDDGERPIFGGYEAFEKTQSKVPGHHNFSQKYFSRNIPQTEGESPLKAP